jgi:hypothetical protein
MTLAPWKLPLRSRKIDGEKWVGKGSAIAVQAGRKSASIELSHSARKRHSLLPLLRHSAVC